MKNHPLCIQGRVPWPSSGEGPWNTANYTSTRPYEWVSAPSSGNAVWPAAPILHERAVRVLPSATSYNITDEGDAEDWTQL